jgi:hypothetical protein
MSINTLGIEYWTILQFCGTIPWSRPVIHQASRYFPCLNGNCHGRNHASKSLVKLHHPGPGYHSAIYFQMVSVALAMSLPASSSSNCEFWLQHQSMSIVSYCRDFHIIVTEARPPHCLLIVNECGKVINLLAAIVFDFHFSYPDILTKQVNEGSNINPPCAQCIGCDQQNDMLTSPSWISSIKGVDSIMYWQSDGIVRTLILSLLWL